MSVNYCVIVLMLRAIFMRYTKGSRGRKKKKRISFDVLWKKVFSTQVMQKEEKVFVKHTSAVWNTHWTISLQSFQ